jgi:hypothetical protein
MAKKRSPQGSVILPINGGNMAQIEAPTNSTALLNLVVEHVRYLGATVQAQQKQIHDLNLELRDRLDQKNRVILVMAITIVAEMFLNVRLFFMALR